MLFMNKSALLSTYDKTGIVELARFLIEQEFSILSTGGTYKTLLEAGVSAMDVGNYTGTPAMMAGRVKTLHPRIHGGILGRRDSAKDIQDMTDNGILPIDIVVVNLYPFFAKAEEGLNDKELTEFIDIGGPTMLRAAAKNHTHVAVLCNPLDYNPFMEEWKRCNGQLSIQTRRQLAGKVFSLTAAYDSAIASHFQNGEAEHETAPEYLTFSWVKQTDLRYGENPHQKAAWYVPTIPAARGPLSRMTIHQGKELSFNNIRDLDAAWRTVNEFDTLACVGVKHAAPCSAALGTSALQAWERSREGDPVSIYGGIAAFNRQVDEETAHSLCRLFLEIVAAPAYTDAALEVFSRKKNLRVLTLHTKRSSYAWEALPVDGGVCLQTVDRQFVARENWTVPTKIKPSQEQMDSLAFAWRVVKHVKSNGIVLAANGATVGIGTGQPNRVGAVNIAVSAAGSRADKTVMASDAFFPFADGVEAAIKAGVTAIIQPGGSIRDADSIQACDAAGIAMVFTGCRHFRH